MDYEQLRGPVMKEIAQTTLSLLYLRSVQVAITTQKRQQEIEDLQNKIFAKPLERTFTTIDFLADLEDAQRNYNEDASRATKNIADILRRTTDYAEDIHLPFTYHNEHYLITLIHNGIIISHQQPDGNYQGVRFYPIQSIEEIGKKYSLGAILYDQMRTHLHERKIITKDEQLQNTLHL